MRIRHHCDRATQKEQVIREIHREYQTEIAMAEAVNLLVIRTLVEIMIIARHDTNRVAKCHSRINIRKDKIAAEISRETTIGTETAQEHRHANIVKISGIKLKSVGNGNIIIHNEKQGNLPGPSGHRDAPPTDKQKNARTVNLIETEERERENNCEGKPSGLYLSPKSKRIRARAND